MTPQEESAFEIQSEKMLAGQREAPNGRNVFAWTMRFLNNTGYRAKFDDTFGGSPSSPEWFSNRFCNQCGKTKAWCECKRG